MNKLKRSILPTGLHATTKCQRGDLYDDHGTKNETEKLNSDMNLSNVVQSLILQDRIQVKKKGKESRRLESCPLQKT